MPALLLSMPQPARTEPASPDDPAQPERAQLRSAIRLLAAATGEAGTAQQPVTRLETVVRAAAEAEATLHRCREADRQRLGEWLASGEGPRPGPSDETQAAAEAHAIARGDAEAAEIALQPLTATLMSAFERVRAAKGRRDEALALAAVAIAHGEADRLRERLERQRERERRRAELMAPMSGLTAER